MSDRQESEQLRMSSAGNVREVNKYVEVPVYEEKVVEVHRKEIITTQKIVPRITTEVREILVEVPRVEVVRKDVDVVHIEEFITEVPRIQRIEVPKEKIRYVPKVEVRKIEKEVEVDGELIEVPRDVEVVNHIVVAKYDDVKEDSVVSQRMIPILDENEKQVMEVTAIHYEPEVVPVDVYVPKPIFRTVVPGIREERYEQVVIPPAHFNALVRMANEYLPDEALGDILLRNEDGSFPMTKDNGFISIVEKSNIDNASLTLPTGH